MGDNPIDKTKEKNQLRTIIIIFIIVTITIYLGYTIFLLACYKFDLCLFFNSSIGAKGQLGDSYGIINSIFSGMAFIGVILTLYFQQKELINQQDQIDNQKKTENQRQFESIFFKLFEIHNNLINSLNFNESAQIYGRQCFDKINTLISTKIINIFNNSTLNFNQKEEINFDEVKNEIETWYCLKMNYYGSLFYILRFIENNEKDLSVKQCLDIFISSISLIEKYLIIFIINFNYAAKKIILSHLENVIATMTDGETKQTYRRKILFLNNCNYTFKENIFNNFTDDEQRLLNKFNVLKIFEDMP